MTRTQLVCFALAVSASCGFAGARAQDCVLSCLVNILAFLLVTVVFQPRIRRWVDRNRTRFAIYIILLVVLITAAVLNRFGDPLDGKILEAAALGLVSVALVWLLRLPI